MASNITRTTLPDRAAEGRDSVYLTGLAMALGFSLGNPLTALSAQVKSLSRKLNDEHPNLDEVRLTIERIEAILDTASSRVGSVTQLFHGPHPLSSTCDLNDVVREAAQRYAHQTFCSRLQIRLELAPDLPQMNLDRAQMARTVAELMLNAAEAMFVNTASDGLMIVRTLWTTGHVRLEIHDSGGGAADPERIFDMSHTTKRERTGMGLSVARALALTNGGQLHASVNERGGLTTTLSLPNLENGNF